MRDDIILAGYSWLPVGDDAVAQIDEAVFECCAAAIRDAGLRRHEVALSVTTSMDLYDARSISNALTAPAAGGYLSDEVRIEGDVMSGLLMAADSIMAGHAEIAIVAGISTPERADSSEDELRSFCDLISSYSFDPNLERPVAMNATATFALHATRALEAGEITEEQMAEQAARDISRADSTRGSRRKAMTAQEILAAPMVATPLTAPMLPALTSAIGAVVITSEPRGRRLPRPKARLRSWSSATSGTTSTDTWLDDPTHSTRAAASRALSAAGHGIDDSTAAVVMTDLSPALSAPTLEALGVPVDFPQERVNPAGGVRANYPGLSNGILRFIESVDALSAVGGNALVHSVDNLAGLTSATSTVLVMEEM